MPPGFPHYLRFRESRQQWDSVADTNFMTKDLIIRTEWLCAWLSWLSLTTELIDSASFSFSQIVHVPFTWPLFLFPQTEKRSYSHMLLYQWLKPAFVCMSDTPRLLHIALLYQKYLEIFFFHIILLVYRHETVLTFLKLLSQYTLVSLNMTNTDHLILELLNSREWLHNYPVTSVTYAQIQNGREAH